jgi:Cu2+-exporting ATPase
MLTGDCQGTAEATAEQVGIRDVIASVTPSGKAEHIRSLKDRGGVIMVGDGINDAPALTEADVGIAIGAGSDIAIDSADAVIMNSSLTDVAAAIRLSRATLRTIKGNLFWAFFYNVLGIPLAAGVFIRLTGWEMSPMIGAAAMSLSSLFVVTNALRLNTVNIKKHKITVKKEKKNMEKIFRVEGMMCPHCEAHVKKAVEAIKGVAEVTASHKESKVTVKLLSEVSDKDIVKAITDAGYTVK